MLIVHTTGDMNRSQKFMNTAENRRAKQKKQQHTPAAALPLNPASSVLHCSPAHPFTYRDANDIQLVPSSEFSVLQRPNPAALVILLIFSSLSAPPLPSSFSRPGNRPKTL